MTYPFTRNDLEHLKSLNRFHAIDTLPQQDFDDIIKMASLLCGSPISAISLVETFQNVVEISTPEHSSTDPLADNFNTRTEQIFIIAESQENYRLINNPLLNGESHIVFYGGKTLLFQPRLTARSLCIIDQEPKALTVIQFEALTALSNQVIKLLELRKRNIELDEQKLELERNIELFKQTSDVARVGGWDVDLRTNKVSWTEVVKQIHELPLEAELDLQTAINFYRPGKYRKIIAGLVVDAIEKGKNFDAELQIITAKGNLRWVRTKGIAEFKNGKCVRIYGVFQDIHDEKVKDLKLAQSEEQFRQTFSHATIGMALVSPRGRWIKVNRSICSMLGYTEEELINSRFADITHPEDLDKDLALLKELIEGKIKSYEIEKRYFHKNGNIVWVILSVSLVRDEKSKPVHFVSQITDITAMKEAEQILSAERKLLTTLLDHLPLNVFVKDLQSRKVMVNRREIEHMGLTNEKEILGKTDRELYNEASANLSLEEDRQIFSTGISIINKETYSQIYDGTFHCFLVSKIALRNERNEITGLVGISYDITERQQNEKKLKELVEVTNEQNVRLLNFAYIVSHNLRSHASNFELLLSVLESENDELSRQSMFAMLKKASNNLSETVIHLQDIVMSTDSTNKLDSINLHQAILNVQDNVKALIQEGNMQVTNEVDESIHIKAVPAYIDSILLNFLTNGLKYKSPHRNPFVKFAAIKSGDNVLLMVSDNGVGIDLEKHGDNLFGMYKTFHGNDDARGVGLFITKNQVESMGGKIEVESKLGEGTTFTVHFNAG